jgi:rubrerythrin
LGPVQPFVNILREEERHVRALRTLFARLRAEAPHGTWTARAFTPDTLVEACAAAGRAELEREATYERLIPLVRDPSARRIMRRIQKASYRRYLPAFRRCFARALKPTGRPRGVRLGRGTP